MAQPPSPNPDPAPPPPDAMRFASLIAHQLQSPIASAESLLRTLAEGAAGPLTPAQKDLLDRASARCDQAIAAARRVLAIARAHHASAVARQVIDFASIAHRVVQRYAVPAATDRIDLDCDLPAFALNVAGESAALEELLDALLHNAIKYTPPGGRVSVTLTPEDDSAVLRVADSGVGIAPDDREKVFQPFFRTPATRQSDRPGTGLGLSFVRAIAVSSGGSVRVEDSPLGGAQLVVSIPLASSPASQAAGAASTPPPLRVVIIGGVAAGPKVAAKVIRLVPDAEVTIIEKGRFLSYAGCGLPYWVSGVVRDQAELMSSPAGAMRDPVFFQKVKNVRVLNRTLALSIDRKSKTVTVRSLDSGLQDVLPYDKLVLATGAAPVVPAIEGANLGNIFTLHGVSDAEGIRAALAEGRARDIVIVGGGLIGVEVTEALVTKGCRVTIVERLGQTLRMLDWEMARLVEKHLESKGVKVLTATSVEGFRGDTVVRQVQTDSGFIPAEAVILGIGVRPNVDLARAAGLDIGVTGAIKVDHRMATSDPDIFAAGDCTESVDILTQRPTWIPLGSTANKQGRVAAVNLCGGDDRFPGILGSTVCRVFDYCVARTGLTEADATSLGYEVVTALAPAHDKAQYMPNARMLLLKIVVDARTRRLIGAQAVGAGAGDKRIDVAAMAITAGMTVDALANVDLCYAPPYAPAMDNLITAANIARNKLDGHMVGIQAFDVKRMLDSSQAFTFLDVRTPAEYERVRLPGSTLIPLGSLRARMGELDRARPIVTFCDISLRGYEAAIILRHAGFTDVSVLDGGVEMWPYDRVS